ncbi:MAG: FAD-binding oxidoreductase [Leptolyngbya sp. SIO4C1]|nr:FAD-binding oxidoreductase [Leptolyngbya sp. SIO4C1]
MVAIAQRLAAIAGAEQVIDQAAMPADWQQRIEKAVPRLDHCLVLPTSEAMLAEVVKACYQNRWPLLVCGSGSKLSWGGLAHTAKVVVSTARLNRIVEHWQEDFTLRAEAGLPLAALQPTLTAAQQQLALDPLRPEQATLGGLVATADTGSLRQRYGGVRDQLIGVQFVRYDGEIAKAGGRVVKNVAGYDLMKLMTGAYGTLGILSQLTFRLFPLPARSHTAILSGSAEAIHKAALAARLSGLTPVALDLVNAVEREIYREDRPKDSAELLLIGRFAGIPAGVEEQLARFSALGAAAGAQQHEADDAGWQQLTDRLGQPDGVLCKVGMLPTETVAFLQLAQKILPTGWLARLHNASGTGLLRFEATAESVAQIQQLRSRCEAAQGYLSLLEAPAEVKQAVDIWGYTGSALSLMKQLKANFDPQGLFNAGRYVGGL